MRGGKWTDGWLKNAGSGRNSFVFKGEDSKLFTIIWSALKINL